MTDVRRRSGRTARDADPGDQKNAIVRTSVLPDCLCTAALRDGRLVRVLPEWTPVTKFGTRITAVGAPERMGLARVRALLRFLRNGTAS